MTGQDNTRLGILLMILVTIVFSVQDGISQHLASRYNVIMVVMIRYWFFAAFVIALAQRQHGGVRQVAVTTQLPLQIFRGVLLAVEICVTVVAFTLFGLVETHAVFVCYPLLVAAMSGPVLGEYVGWRRWTAIGVGFVGVLIILEPGSSVFSIYALLTRYAARRDSTATSFFWTGIAGAAVMTLVGIWFWQSMSLADWVWMAALCMTGRWAIGCLFAVTRLPRRVRCNRSRFYSWFLHQLSGLWCFPKRCAAMLRLGPC